ncbi:MULTISPECIES: hypothetical protein [unclassified Sphingopyxis]|uniref:hypothetical protein n=1 Tax=unclassified Sphingopyxis TaxID=2614943 RepID=UPI00073187E6|nr:MULTISPECIES: hypothetical protein [unclassified Sphingopyxis]KTE19898.1 hypothetical protein ATE61_20250 [Sphingopyxis sp. H057]KTE48885.1 hypothetical protein ATE64_20200 [Sphingopyxis sp. H073]KTE53303.1 hypothetical protein ATE69_13395 [Sphingopyxis sp. H071]KTE55328.1 hypothetical protein ATE66_19755 [Sphingopyxis sp. H107]KTE60215.1 hypothetical protein ATE65_19560 [Sphingopyxis sp. H100]
MELRYSLSGSVLFSTEADRAPSVGDKITIRTEQYKKGLHAGSLISFVVSDEWPPEYDDSEGRTVVHIDVNDYEILEEGPSPD